MRHPIYILVTAAMIFAASTFAQDYDLVINGGRVMDPETITTR